MKNSLNIIELKKRNWLLFVIAIPLAFILFVMNALAYQIFLFDGSKLKFYLSLLLLLFELNILSNYFTKLRYTPKGKIEFDKNGIYSTHEKLDLNLGWEKIESLNFYYGGDYLWERNFLFLILNLGADKYSQFVWNWSDETAKQNLNYIELNEEKLFIKIRDQSEKDNFFDLVQLAEEKGFTFKKFNTDYTISFQGRKQSIKE